MNKDSLSPENSRRLYWARTRQWTLLLLLVWFVFTFVTSYFADTLNQIVIFGFPLGFYMAAQGNLLIYALIVGAYVVVMQYLEKRYGIRDGG
ncbi:MAG: DUF4212 domain-containing protein [Azovibrio sp.]